MAKRYVRPVESRQFLIRRLHSLSGIIPVGVFLFFHIGTNSLIAVSKPNDDLYQKQVDNIHNLGPLLIPVEVLFILVPLAYHCVVGVKIWLESKPNARNYPYGGNIRYTLQRLTGMITLAFILVHLYQMHWLGNTLRPEGIPTFHHEQASATTARVMQHASWIAPFYALGVICACYHLANGFWTFMITWGVIIGPRSQRIAGYACTALGAALILTGLAAVRGFATFDVNQERPAVRARAVPQPSEVTSGSGVVHPPPG
ncbi:MAG: hypothetical protein HY718_07960 [Planctomycetes bacterium]|nr:hypothetical protein [Planctomycetota bacterium]